MAKGRTRNARDDKKDRLASGLQLSRKAKRQLKKKLVSAHVQEARGDGKAPSAHKVLRAQGIPEARAPLHAPPGGDSPGAGKKRNKKKPSAALASLAGVPNGGHTRCRGGHELQMMRAPHDEYVCDGCDAGFLKKGSQLFGCRICDWDACARCTAPAVVTAALVQEEAEKRVMLESKEARNVSREGEWQWLRKVDAYQNRFLQLRHSGSGVVAELHHYSVGQFTFRPGAGAKSYCVAETVYPSQHDSSALSTAAESDCRK